MHFLKANWDAPSHVQAFSSMQDPMHPKNYNLALHVEDDEAQVLQNRDALNQYFSWKKPPIYLNQTHSNICINADQTQDRDADAALSRQKHQSLIILTADCLPILICHRHKSEIASIHAGWRGLYNGIIENTFQQFQDSAQNYLVWLGPCICQNCYQVQADFKSNFLQRYPQAEACFTQKQGIYFSLTDMAEHILNRLGVTAIYHAKQCTFENKAFYSYRRQAKTGRIASMIWLED